MAPLLKVLLLLTLVYIFVPEINAKHALRKRGMHKRRALRDAAENTEALNSDDDEKRGMWADLLGFGDGDSSMNTLPNNNPSYVYPPPMVPQVDPIAPTINIPNINNQQNNYQSHNRPSLLSGLLSGGLLSMLDKDKGQQQQQQHINMDWVKYALQKCGRFDTRKLTTILPSAANGLTSPHMYYFANATSDKKTWEEAQRYCTENGMELLTINDAAENAVIQQQIQQIIASSPFDADTGATNPNQFWIGLHDADLNEIYNWVGDGSSSYADWFGGVAPDAPAGCVTLEQQNTQNNIHMSGYDCADLDKFRYICEVSDECMALFMSLLEKPHKKKPSHGHGFGFGHGSY